MRTQSATPTLANLTNFGERVQSPPRKFNAEPVAFAVGSVAGKRRRGAALSRRPANFKRLDSRQT